MSLSYNKEWYKSKTVWGAVIAIIGAVLGIAVPDVATTTTVINSVTGAATTATDTTGSGIDIPNIIAAAGGALALYGRVKATAALTK